MNEIVFSLSSRQRLLFLVAGGVLALMGLTSVLSGGGGGFQLILGVIFVGYYFWFARFGSTLTPQGIVVRGLSTQYVPWQQIARIDTYNVMGGRGVVLRLATGGNKRLRAPMSAPLQRDPDFDAKLATIQQWWQHYAGRQQAPGPAGYGSR